MAALPATRVSRASAAAAVLLGPVAKLTSIAVAGSASLLPATASDSATGYPNTTVLRRHFGNTSEATAYLGDRGRLPRPAGASSLNQTHL